MVAGTALPFPSSSVPPKNSESWHDSPPSDNLRSSTSDSYSSSIISLSDSNSSASSSSSLSSNQDLNEESKSFTDTHNATDSDNHSAYHLIQSWKKTKATLLSIPGVHAIPHSHRNKKYSVSVHDNHAAATTGQSYLSHLSTITESQNTHNRSGKNTQNLSDNNNHHYLSKLKNQEDESDNSRNRAFTLISITIPHGFQLTKSILQPYPTVKNAIYLSSNSNDAFAVMDNESVSIIRGSVRVLSFPIEETKDQKKSPVLGLSRWIYVKKWRVTIAATLHLELKVSDLID